MKSKLLVLGGSGLVGSNFINKNKDDYVKNISELEIFPFISAPIKKLQSAGFKIIVITNQSAINRGLMTKKYLNFTQSFFYIIN
tara:strand:+ start:155 stop:406 length:252 start_codon:yes stop_codon:yes gene_type:complete